ncbi:MAG: eCIS core domain-containing protein, partial [Methylobacter sp.]
MQHKTIQAKTIRQDDAVADKSQDAGRNAAAKAPPAYGLDFIDRQANSNGLPAQLKTGIERLSGLSMNDVKVHYNSSKPAQLQALAYTQGTDIHVAP